MKNTTTIKVPKKYQPMIDEIFKDDDGYWAYSNYGYMFEATECHTAHGYTIQETLQDIRSLKECDCDECKKELNKGDIKPRVITQSQIDQYLLEEYEGRYTEKQWIEGLMEDNQISEEESYDALADNVYDYFNKGAK